ncbi:MAG: helix-turn-helix transcriptional regulator [Candidatus Aminicenantes bacterium]|nr:helix-turn-helix transcriptional regulator [Candidatus Aminicenantes bacterium]
MIGTHLNEIGSRVKKIRTSLDLTLKQMAEKTGLSAGFLSQIEKGIKRPSAIYLFFLLVEHKVNINWILSGKGDIYLTENLVEKSRAFDFGGDREAVEEMLHDLEQNNHVRHSFLSFYYTLKKTQES